MARLAKHAGLFLLYGASGALLGALVALAWFGTAGRPPLERWHVAQLDEEFTRDSTERVQTLEDYLQLEERVFAELKRKVYDDLPAAGRRLVERYSTGSHADPTAYARNYNRTLVLEHDHPRAAVLMVHGLTDSPYSLRALAERLHAADCEIVLLRLPGHGTVPAGLLDVRWEDWGAALRLAMRDLRARVGADVPLHIVGYSAGAALAVEYSLAALEDESLPEAQRLVLISPAIGVDRLAWLAVWQRRIAELPGLGKLAWLDILPEYDPYKYNSFAVNAGDQIYRLTREIDARMGALAEHGPVRGFPRTLVFQSVVDATVSPLDVVGVFMGRLAPEGHALVAFDINRSAEVEPLLKSGLRERGRRLLTGSPWPFDVTILENADPASRELVARRRAAGEASVTAQPTGLEWPAGVFSLSHIALPIAQDDPIYGAVRPVQSTAIYLGRIEIAGENGVLQVSPSIAVRLRFDPFFGYLEERTRQFLNLTEPRAATAAEASPFD